MTFAVLLLAIVFVFVLPGRTVPAEPIASASPPISASPSATAQRIVQAYGANIDRAAEDVLGFLLAVAKLVAAALAVLIVIAALRKLWNVLLSAPVIVFGDLTDGTGEPVLAASMPGVSELARGHLRTYVKETGDAAITGTVKAPSPIKAKAADDIAKVLETVKDVVPNPAKAILVLLGALLPSRNGSVAGRLLSTGDRPGQLGIAIEVSPTTGEDFSEVLWEATPLDADLGWWPDKRARADRLVQLAMHWTALRLWRDRALEAAPRNGFPKRLSRALVRNFVGRQLAKLGAHHGDFFDRQAQSEYREATRLYPMWYGPHEGLADVSSFRAIRAIEANPLEARDLQLMSIAEYGHAIKKLGAKNVKAVSDALKDADRDLVEQIAPRNPKREEIRTQLEVARAISRRHCRLPGAAETVEAVERALEGHRHEITYDELFYSLASWYATRLRLEGWDRNLAEVFGWYVLAALARDRKGYGNWPLDDPDLKLIPRQWRERLLLEMDRALADRPELKTDTTARFTTDIDNLLAGTPPPQNP